MCADASTILRAVAADFFFNCWYLEIPSDNRIRHIILNNDSWKITYFHVYRMIIYGVGLVAGFIGLFTYRTTIVFSSLLHTYSSVCSHVFSAVTR
jgi:hypothetical protein